MRERLMVGIGSCVLCVALLAMPSGVAAAEDFGLDLDASVSLVEIAFDEGEKGTDLQIQGSAPFMYTAYNTESGVYVLDLPGVDVSRMEDTFEVGTPEISGVRFVSPNPEEGIRYARLEVHLGPRGGKSRSSMDPAIPNTLHVFVQRLAEPRPAPLPKVDPAAAAKTLEGFDPNTVLAPAAAEKVAQAEAPTINMGRKQSRPAPRGPAAKMLQTISLTPRGEVLAVDLLADGVLEYSSFYVANPDRLVLDLRGVHESIQPGAIIVGSNGVQKIRIAQHQPDPEPVVRVVLDASGSLSHTVDRHAKGLTLYVSDKGEQALASVMSAGGSPATGAAPASGDSLLASAESLGRVDDWSAAPARQQAMPAKTPKSNDLYETQGAVEVPASLRPSFEPRVLGGEELQYTGRPISLDLRNAPIVDIFRLFHELSGLNIVVDPSVGEKIITIDVDMVPWDQVLDLVLKSHSLGKSFEGNVLRIAPANKLAQEEREQQQLRDAKEAAQPLRTVTRTLSYARATEVEQIINRIVRTSGGGSANQGAVSIVDERTNTLILRDTDQKIDEINELIDQLDVPARQVLIEARIVAAEKNWTQQFGIRWGFDYVASPEFGNQTDFNFPNSVVSNYALNLPQQGAQQITLAFSNILNTFNLNVALDASELEGTSRTISAPRIIAQNNEEASIENGTQLPIVSTTATEIDVRFVSASLRLTVTPQITRDDTVILELSVENNSISGVSVGDVPGITTQQASTTVLVPNGGTTVIGGIYKLDEGDSENRIPVLHRIPLLGWLFKNKSRRSQNQELMIFVTPRILN